MWRAAGLAKATTASGEFTAYDIMKYAGHADLKTAERYMWLAPERVSLRS